MKLVLLIICFMTVNTLLAQTLSKGDLDKIQSSFRKDAYTKAMQNALSSNDITQLAWSRENAGTTDQLFTYRSRLLIR